MQLPEFTKRYILNFLCNECEDRIIDDIAYLPKGETNTAASFIIESSGFFESDAFGTPDSFPDLPLKCWNDTPLLFGEPVIETIGDKTVIHADVIASSYFLLTRYEELFFSDIRDEFRRFPGKESLLYKAGFINRPVVDEYGKILREILRKKWDIPERTGGFSHIYLTHDVDAPWEHFTCFRAIKRIVKTAIRNKRIIIYPLLNSLGFPEHDPLYVFPKIISDDENFKTNRADTSVIYFFLVTAGGVHKNKSAYYGNSACNRMIKKAKKSGDIGIHFSYTCGKDPSLCHGEYNRLKNDFPESKAYSRFHYLPICKPDTFNYVSDEDITDDFSLGYADVAGFRLGTSHPVKYIDPLTGKVYPLTLHPLPLMDATFVSPKYMNMSEKQEILKYAMELIKSIYENNGELTILYHNHFNKEFGSVYHELLNGITVKFPVGK